MFCPNCGKSAEAGVRFCPSCGTQISSAGYTGSGYPPQPVSKLVRPRYPRMIAGVCSGIALQYGWDLSLVRILTVVFALVTSGFGGLCYLAAWGIIPEGAYALPPASGYPSATNPPSGSTGNTTV
ncbi:phage shock protein C [Granulicella aggregans]|uniref:Phage shock protein C n=1 Tax=Granulicella aggregans TaxID=474949 RepID=A0A7W7ZDZ5_9BACT|nr:PspC domain-containing protein [Granulicella aggregans]MBB5057839.1 phage shock protein C [Granulicella aggregans]